MGEPNPGSGCGPPMPPGTGLVIVSSFFHRDERALPYADRFEPEIWLDGRAQDDWSLIPFSGGPATRPGSTRTGWVASCPGPSTTSPSGWGFPGRQPG
jgi:hypothetical protein